MPHPTLHCSLLRWSRVVLYHIYYLCQSILFFFFFNDTATPEISPLPLPDALPISRRWFYGGSASELAYEQQAAFRSGDQDGPPFRRDGNRLRRTETLWQALAAGGWADRPGRQIGRAHV